MAQKGWIVDRSKCVGCRACTVACRMENNSAGDVAWRWVIEKESGTYPEPQVTLFSMGCYHCADPACRASCAVGAITKDAETGIVLIDQDMCIGCKYCMATCPYGAPQFNESTGKVEKCTYCVQRTALEEPLLPACALTCVGGGIRAAEDETWDGSGPEGWSSRNHTNPSVKFIG